MNKKLVNIFNKIFFAFLIIALSICNLVVYADTEDQAQVSEISSSYAITIWQIISAIRNLAGIACLLIILIAIFKIIVGDEQDNQRYIKRIKNALIALILILVVANVGNFVTNYFTKYSDVSTFTIGDISNTSVQLEDINAGLTESAKDVYEEVEDKIEGAEDWSGIYLINGSWYYCDKHYDKKNIGTLTNYFGITEIRLLRSVQNDDKSYWVLSCNSKYYETAAFDTGTEIYSDTTGEREYFVLEYTGTVKITDATELGDAIFGRAVTTTENAGTSDEFNYWKVEEDSVNIY